MLMHLLEHGIALLAPHICIGCGREGSVLCSSCARASLLPPPSRCYRCYRATRQSRVCTACRRVVALKHVWIAARYSGQAKELVYKLKFERAAQAAEVLAGSLHTRLPLLPPSVVLTHIPTVNARVRRRGYDQARLIALQLSKYRGWSYAPLLVRRGRARQLGARRAQRFAQAESAFEVRKQRRVQDVHVLLIDDVLTTGATIEAAAQVLKAAGAKTIEAAIFAQP